MLLQSPQSKLSNVIKIKFDGKRLISIFKYLNILRDQHLKRSSQTSQVRMKLTREIDILSKLKKY